jgi:glycoside/pentoside/hexuronide:cation symporter, GPH family
MHARAAPPLHARPSPALAAEGAGQGARGGPNTGAQTSARTSAPVPNEPTPAAFDANQGWRYGGLGFALAFVALPLYVLLPNHYALQFGVPLATLGALLLAARLLDALIDPLLGRWIDGLFARSAKAVLRVALVAAAVLALGFVALFFPPTAISASLSALLLWAGGALLVTYVAYSVMTVAHQAWGAMLGGGEAQRARVVAWREAFALTGVLVASVTPSLLGLPVSAGIFVLSLLLGWLLWRSSRAPDVSRAQQHAQSVWRPFESSAFRRLLLIFVVNGIASAVPATLVLFFIQDRLQAPASMQGVFLGSYFLCAALSMALWLRFVPRFGLARLWAAAMLLAVAVFVFATQIQAGDVPAYVLICALSGVALGADLALPPAMLAGVIARAGDRGQHEGAYFGWWNFCTKLNLALAAGLALPLLALFGYAPGARAPSALNALVMAYCVLPCVLKLIATALLWQLWIKKEDL